MKTCINPLRRATVTALLSALACFGQTAAHAADGRDFAGSYQITRVVGSGPDVTVTISLTFVNYADEPLRGARVTLKDSKGHGIEHGAFAALASIEHRASNRLVGTFRVPITEFNEWLNGSEPRFVVTRTDKGRKVERPIAVVRTGGVNP